MSTEISIGRGLHAIVDDNIAHLRAIRWCGKRIAKGGRKAHIYAAYNTTIDGKRTTIYMHRLIAEAGTGVLVDHINRNTLDNRKENLRLADAALNSWNRSVSHGKTSTGIRGVSLAKDGSYYIQVQKDRKRAFSRSGLSLEEATETVVRARDMIEQGYSRDAIDQAIPRTARPPRPHGAHPPHQGKEACVNGHPFTAANTYWTPRPNRPNPSRRCRICMTAASLRCRQPKSSSGEPGTNHEQEG